MTERKVCFSFGALSDDFSTQLKQQGYELKNKEKWDKAVFSAVYLYIHDILTASRYDECLKRIIKKSKVDWLQIEAKE
ncbi:hypothetical protein [uncultured Eubacterium sp.]|uniref:hypothetical protein n=1 Tax=uncultured Eubacterium sp. TaxID=165185 RepID=UPI0026187F04|nr:hypothetical protein [uncultured Eubacterium sp.]